MPPINDGLKDEPHQGIDQTEDHVVESKKATRKAIQRRDAMTKEERLAEFYDLMGKAVLLRLGHLPQRWPQKQPEEIANL